MKENRFRLFVVMAKVAAVEGDLQRAEVHLEHAEHLHRPVFMQELRPIPAMRARVWITQGRLAEAAEWARSACVTAADEVDHLREFDLFTLARLLIAQHRIQPDSDAADRALSLLGRLHQVAGPCARRRSVVESHILSALALDQQGHRTQAMASLAAAWADEAEPGAYVRLFLDEGEPMFDLLRATHSHGMNSDRAQRLLDLIVPVRHEPDVPARESALSTIPSTLIDALSVRELHVLRLLATDLSGPEIASELFVSIHTIRTHTKRIFTKLDVTNRRAAVSRARELGLL
jgi:LuxR family maltose regulon positive regulatory protein